MSLPTDYQRFIAVSRYSRWLDDENRRETWEETVDRYVTNIVKPKLSDNRLVSEIRKAIVGLEVMPSMRALMVAGPAAERDNCALYNCSFVSIDHPRAFDEALYILTCGTGLGFSCEQSAISKLPEIAEEFHDTDTTIVVADSRIGWASSFRELIQLLYGGKVPRIDVSKVRPKGERLKTFGGRASGPDPLVDLFNYTIRVFKGAAGRKLSDIEVHGLVCKIGEIVVVGGVRRSALISLSDLGSERMRGAKSLYKVVWHTVNPDGCGNVRYVEPGGEEHTQYVKIESDHDKKLLDKMKIGSWIVHPEFALANNSAVYDEKPTTGEFLDEWSSLYESKSGERGIYFRKGIRDKTDRIGRRDSSLILGTNPCGEIALRNAGLCNLTEIVVRPDDDLDSLKRKARIATILGTIQSTYTNFRYIRSVWKRNAEEERLLGVSLTGIFDNKLLSSLDSEDGLPELLQTLKDYCVEINRQYADKLGINPSVAISTVKPSGTVSQLVDSSSGIHPRHSQYYLRAVRQDNKDPLTAFMKAKGFPNEPCAAKPESTTIFYFPMKAPDGAITRDMVDPVSHLKLWKIYNERWAEHQVSITVSVDEHQWLDTGAWVFRNFSHLSGVSFLPLDKGTYQQAPYQDMDKESYEYALSHMPKDVDWSELSQYELEDQTTSARDFACMGDRCEIL